MDWPDSFFPSREDERYFEKMDEDSDLAFALSLQEAFNEDAVQEVLSKEAQASGSSAAPYGSSKALGIVDAQWELIDPNPDIHALFLQFNTQFFYGKLLGVEVKWSPRMTMCAGVCSYEGRGGLCSVRLSQPLLGLRPRKDLVETLLHEMIHAYLFVTANNKDREGHGPEFLSHMYRINKLTGTNISVYHSFHDEVAHFQTHWWKCNGPCQNRRPFYGIVKRAMNRAPGPNDRWWKDHVASCGGTFIKIKEPEQAAKSGAKRKLPKENAVSKNTPNIKSFFPTHPSTSKTDDSPTQQIKKPKGKAIIHTINSVFEKENNMVPVNGSDSSKPTVPADSLQNRIQTEVFSGKGFTLGSSSSSVQPKSLLSQIRKEIGYPNSRNVAENPVTKVTPPNNGFKSTSPSVAQNPMTKVNPSEKGFKLSGPSVSSVSKNVSVPSVKKEIGISNSKSVVQKSTATINAFETNFTRATINPKVPTAPRVSKTQIGNPNSRSVAQKPLDKINSFDKSSKPSTPKNSKIPSVPTSHRKKQGDVKSSKDTSNVLGGIQSPSGSSSRKLLQSSIDSFVVSPDRPSGNNLKKASNATSSVDKIDNSKIVPCPVCSVYVPSDTINIHLDDCLSKCS